jgi:hypothetical protein
MELTPASHSPSKYGAFGRMKITENMSLLYSYAPAVKFFRLKEHL